MPEPFIRRILREPVLIKGKVLPTPPIWSGPLWSIVRGIIDKFRPSY